MTTESLIQSVCSVTAMAKKLSLSRSRFYELLDQGIFPKPVNYPGINHRFYTSELQKQCMQVKQTGIGINGKPVLFYLPRKNKAVKTKYAKDPNLDSFTSRLFGLLKSMGTSIKISQLRDILIKLYPDGLPQWPIDQIELRKIMHYTGGRG